MKLAVFIFVVVLSVVTADEVWDLTSASNEFAQRLYQKIGLDRKNVCYSPYSIHLALSMTSVGAAGDTQREMFQILGLESLRERAHDAYRQLISETSYIPDVKLLTANGLFVNPRSVLEQSFLEQTDRYYFANASSFNLTSKEGPEKSINEYVEERTEGQIKDILEKNTITDKTLMVLVNTLFLNATWEKQFPENKTEKKDFYREDGRTVEVRMMNDQRQLNMKKNVDGVDVVELPLRGLRFSVFVALPQRKDGIRDLEKSLSNPGKLNQLLEGLDPIWTNISLPRFEIESSYKLRSPLIELGMPKAFDKDRAEFPGMSRNGSVYINEITHKSVFSVCELGVSASSASAVEMSSASEHPGGEETFLADHPFLVFLRDTKTKQILFQAKFCGEK